MCISPAACNHKGLSALELIIVVLIIAVLGTLSMAIWKNHVDYESAENAQAMLKIVWQSQEEFYSWKNTYADQFKLLTIPDPNKSDLAYNYTIERADHAGLLIRATKKGANTGFVVDEAGNITAFPLK